MAAIAVVAALGGCGRGGDSSSTVAGGGEGTGTTTQGESGGSSRQSGSKAGKGGRSSGQAGDDTTSPSNGGGSPGNSATPPGNPGGSSGGSGGSSGKGVTPSGGLSKSEFIKRASAICNRGKRQSFAKMVAYVKRHGGNAQKPSPAALAKAVNAVFLPGVQAQIDEIRALGAPPGDEAKVEAFLGALEEGVEAASRISPSAAVSFGKSFTRSAKLAHQYGIDSCAYN